MGIFELFLIAVGLSMDAFAVSVCKGLGMSRFDMRQALIIGLFFGGFQAFMPLIGWALGAQFAQYVTAVSHWIAFGLLVFIGGKMLWDSLCGDDSGSNDEFVSIRELFMLAIATSIDALAVGVTFAFLDVAIAPSVALIGVTTFVISIAGVAIGHVFGSRWEKPAEIAGGIILILIGVKVLLEGLGF